MKEFLTEDEIGKLPKWAQSKVKVLQMRLGEHDKELKRMKSNTPSNTYHDILNKTYLKDNANVGFDLVDGSLQASIKRGSLEIYASSDKNLCILPVVSNVISISFK